MIAQRAVLQRSEPTPTYSICVTNYNSAKTIRNAISSIMPLLSMDKFEIVAVDNESSDDSLDFLKDLHRRQIVTKLSVRKCSRGGGRNFAMHLASGKYLISNIDMDVIYNPDKILAAIRDYHDRFEGKVLSITGMMILPRVVALRLGGWKDLDRHEDNEIALHAYELGLHAQNESMSVLKEHLKDKARDSLLPRLHEAYISFRDWFRIGLRFSDLPSNQAHHPTVIAGYLSSKFHKSYRNPSFSEWWKLGWSGVEYGMVASTEGEMKKTNP